jgi:putative RNA 2'-phosphotransferase
LGKTGQNSGNMDKDKMKKTSKFLSLVLRHQPQIIDLQLDELGWANVEELLQKAKIDRDTLDYVIENNDKKRFRLSEDGTKIKASQGHTIAIEADFLTAIPPDFLYHGTNTAAVNAIKNEGIKKMSRHHVHLSADVETATKVGQRRKGELTILTIKAKEMHHAGMLFYISANGVWLVKEVPSQYITVTS